MTYAEKLKDPRWQKKRLKILERDNWTCMACGEKEETLHVHHIFYLPKTEPWNIPDGLLITFCQKCHHPAPCDDSYRSCNDCPEHKVDCDGLSYHTEEIVIAIASLLSVLWSNARLYGGRDYLEILYNVSCIMTPKGKV